jgi:hypothetical protein
MLLNFVFGEEVMITLEGLRLGGNFEIKFGRAL